MMSPTCNRDYLNPKLTSGNHNITDTTTLYSYFETGVLARKASILADSTLHGAYADFYRSGGVKNEANYYFGHREGYWKQYYPNGKVASIHQYHAGRLNGPFKLFDEKGWLTQQGAYRNNYLSGKLESYYGNGNLRSEYYFGEQDKRLRDVEYYRSGHISGFKQYLDGYLVFEIKLAPDGQILKKIGNAIFDIQIDKTHLFWDAKLNLEARLAIPPNWTGQLTIGRQSKSGKAIFQSALTHEHNKTRFSLRLLPNKRYQLLLKASIYDPLNPVASFDDEFLVVLDLEEQEIYYPVSGEGF